VALGWTQSRDEALASAGVSDRWTAVGQVIEEDERFRTVRTWLLGVQTGRRALILDFAAGAQPLERSVVGGSSFDGDLAFYPSRQPLRALLKSRTGSLPLDQRSLADVCDRSIEAALVGYAQALAANPWIFRWPLALTGVRPVRDGARWFLVDPEERGLPVRTGFAKSLQWWRLVAARAGSPMTVIVEWDGVSALPISAFAESPDEYLDLAPRWAA
jgi:hypothetical protein